METGILVIDIGMTNKKVAVYDENLSQIDVAYKNFEPIMISGKSGTNSNEKIPAHDLEGMKKWFSEQIRVFAAKYPIKAISVTTHGATFVSIDKDGSVSAPCVFYTFEPGESFQKEFYDLCGSPADLQKETFTPRLNSMINLAKGIFFLKKEFPAEFNATDTILNFPQYWAFLLTGKKSYEETFLACHTYLWRQNEHEWSSVIEKLGIKGKMPHLYSPATAPLGKILPEVAKNLGLNEDVIVTAGIHDSNASLLPYLAEKQGGNFVLNSTGTWCVLMHPDTSANKKATYANEDIGKIVFFNRSAFDQPVKTAIFLGGLETDSYVKIFKKINKTEEFPSSNIEEIQNVLSKKEIFLLPEIVSGSGQFPSSKAGIYISGRFYPFEKIADGSLVPEIFRDEKTFWATLVISMVIQTDTALSRLELKKGTAVFTEGGFRKNALYNSLLASVRKSNSFYLTSIKEATAAGSAMCAIMALRKIPISQFAERVSIEKIKIEPQEICGYESYKQEWLRYAVAEEQK